MNKTSNKAFTLLEIMIVLVAIAFMATTVITRIRTKPEKELSFVFDKLNTLVSYTCQEAISKQKIYRIFLKSNKNDLDYILIEQESPDPENVEKKIYTPASSFYIKTKYVLPKDIKFVSFYQNKTDQYEDNKGNGYCYVNTAGVIQDCFIHIKKETEAGQEKMTFKSVPFFGKFEKYEGFLSLKKLSEST